MKNKGFSLDAIFPGMLNKIFGISSIILLLLSFFSNNIVNILQLLQKFSIFSYLSINALNLIFEMICWAGLLLSSFRYWFPIERDEISKVALLSGIFFTNVSIYTLARIVKDSVIVESLGSNGSTFAKVLILVYSLSYGVWYKNLAQRSSLKKILYVAAIPSLLYFSLYSFVLSHPNITYYILPSAGFITKLDLMMNIKVLGIKPLLFFSGFIDLLKIWPSTIFYILAEMWGVTLTQIFFWQMANNTVLKNEIKRFYPVILLIAQFAQLLAGNIGKSYNESSYFIPLCGGVLSLLGVLMILLSIFYLNNYKEIFSPSSDKSTSTSLWALIKENRIYIIYPALLSIFYGVICLGLENGWKQIMKQTGHYTTMYSSYILIQAKISVFLSILGAPLFATYFSWGVSAFATPIIAFIGVLFLNIYYGLVTFCGITFGIDPKNATYIIILAGSIVVALTKAFKYILFDRSKEEYTRLLGSELTLAKSIEGQYSKLGKSGFALLNAFALGFSSMIIGDRVTFLHPAMLFYLFIVSVGVCILWIISVKKMSDIVSHPEVLEADQVKVD